MKTHDHESLLPSLPYFPVFPGIFALSVTSRVE